jgi:small GTP-binding protein
VTLKDGSIAQLHIWDTAGQERYHTLNRDYYMKADGAILVYDVCNEDSFKNVRLWSQELGKFGNSACISAVAGNKSDLSKSRKIQAADATEICKTFSKIYKETSAQSGAQVNEFFTELAEAIVEADDSEMDEETEGCCVVQ